LNALWSLAGKLETATLRRSTDHLQHLILEIPRNEPRLDSLMFVQHNVTAWQEPSNFLFEPSPVWLDDSDMAVDEVAKIFLRNVLSKSKGRLGELKEEVDRKRKEVDAIKRIRQNIQAGKDKRDEVELVRTMFSVQEDLHQSERKRLTAEVEADTITAVVGDLSVGAQNHNFKAQTFKIPTNCDLCGDRIWGLSAKGFDCRDCGYTCHSKCELKVPASCPGELSKDERKKTKVERQQDFNAPHPHVNGDPPEGVTELPALSRSNTMNSLSSGYAASANRSVSGLPIRQPPDENAAEKSASPLSISKPQNARRNRIIAPPPAQYISEMSANDQIDGHSSVTSIPREQRGKMLYSYQATGDGEISVSEGEELTIIEPDGTNPPPPFPPNHKALI
jgi:formin-binding protein 1